MLASSKSNLSPHEFFACKTLVSLSFLLSVPDSISLPRLKKLRLRLLIFNDDEPIRRLFSGCPVLEELIVWGGKMNNTRVFEVSFPSLKRLYLDISGDFELLLNVPNLETLYCEWYAASGYRVVDVFKCLIEAQIIIQNSRDQFVEQGKICELLGRDCNVRLLTLYEDTVKSLRHFPSAFPTFHNLTYLELDCFDSEGWLVLPSLLHSSPNLEYLPLDGEVSDTMMNFVEVRSPHLNMYPCRYVFVRVHPGPALIEKVTQTTNKIFNQI